MVEMTSELREAIDNAYAALPEVRWRGRSATVCACCVDEKDARALAMIPRKLLDADLIRQYLGSAHHHSEGSADAEVRHFTPRIFELLALGCEVDMAGNAYALKRLGRGPLGWGDETYRAVFSAREIDAVERFERAYWRAVLNEAPELWRRPDDGLWQFDNYIAEDTLCMIALTGDDLAPLMAIWDAEMSANASLHMAALVFRATWTLPSLARRELGSGYWEKSQAAMRSVADWLVSGPHRDRLLGAFMGAEQGSPQAFLLAQAHDELDRILDSRAKAAS